METTHSRSRSKNTYRIFWSVGFFGYLGEFLAFGAQNKTKEPHLHNPAQLPSQSLSDSVHCVKNAAAYYLARILPFCFSSNYPPHLRRVWLAFSPPSPFFTFFLCFTLFGFVFVFASTQLERKFLANSRNFLDISFILQCVLGCNNGIRGFNENLVTVWGTKLPGF